VAVFLASCAKKESAVERANLNLGRNSSEIQKLVRGVFVLGFDGVSEKDAQVKKLSRMAKKGELGGVILFAKNIKSPSQVKALNALFDGVLVAVDEEGGRVTRFKESAGFEVFKSAEWVGANLSASEAGRYYEKMASQLKGLGFNLNFAPVVDLKKPNSPIISKVNRAFSSEPEKVAAYAGEFLKAHKKHGVLTSLKHFAGHGGATSDTHLKKTVVAKFDTAELLPFERLASEADSVMVSHVYFSEFDAANPAVFSPVMVKKLRSEVGFEGLVVSDDLLMGGVADVAFGERVVRALGAGVELLIVSVFDEKRLKEAEMAVVKAVELGRLNVEVLVKANLAVEKFKKSVR